MSGASSGQINNSIMNDTSADQHAREILSKMTLKEKVYEMHGHGLLRFGLSVFLQKIKPVEAGGNKRLGIPATDFSGWAAGHIQE